MRSRFWLTTAALGKPEAQGEGTGTGVGVGVCVRVFWCLWPALAKKNRNGHKVFVLEECFSIASNRLEVEKQI